jgi:thiaminase/transcriptional activator TenA
MNGTLERDKFSFYIEQDSLYLQDFSRCHALIASRIPLQYVRAFLRYADFALIAEQEVVHQYFKNEFRFQEIGILTPATIAYTNYLLRMCSMEPCEIGIAAILPCFWIYREVGLYIAEHSMASNPYARWIEIYASKDFSKSVDEAIGIFNDSASKANEITRQKMRDAFYTSSVLEWHFWNDAYEKRGFDTIGINIINNQELAAYG